MIRHIFTLIWNRRRANALLIAEVFLAFLVLFAVATIGTQLWYNYRQPLGFRYDNVWQVSYSPGTQSGAAQLATLQRVLAQIRTIAGVQSVAVTLSNTPFSFNDSRSSLDNGALQDINRYQVGPELRDLLGLEVVAGRWFEQRDQIESAHPSMIIDERLQQALFPNGESAINKFMPHTKPEARIIGVVRAYRTDGELQKPRPAMFYPVFLTDTTYIPRTLLVQVRPGSGAALEKRLADDIRRIGPGWSSTTRTLDEMHVSQLKQLLTQPLLLGMMSIFLLLNVALGLFGVLWLAISARRAELGVRRALGASAGAISGLIVSETLAITTCGLVLGLLVAVQFPLLRAYEIPVGVYGTAMVLAAAGLYGLAVVCALYPSQLAAGIQPAVALREE